jgi:hypothetical protein
MLFFPITTPAFHDAALITSATSASMSLTISVNCFDVFPPREIAFGG